MISVMSSFSSAARKTSPSALPTLQYEHGVKNSEHKIEVRRLAGDRAIAGTTLAIPHSFTIHSRTSHKN
jgi:hypothetical protein